MFGGGADVFREWLIDTSGYGPVTVQSVIGTVNTKEGRASTATRTSVAASATVVQLLAANANRLDSSVYNDSAANLYVILGTGGSTTDFTVKLASGGIYEVAYGYTGVVRGVWDSATGSARITELT